VVQVAVLVQQLHLACAQLPKATTLQGLCVGQHFVMASSVYVQQWVACHLAAPIKIRVDYPE
jgi:hypothetical protein